MTRDQNPTGDARLDDALRDLDAADTSLRADHLARRDALLASLLGERSGGIDADTDTHTGTDRLDDGRDAGRRTAPAAATVTPLARDRSSRDRSSRDRPSRDRPSRGRPTSDGAGRRRLRRGARWAIPVAAAVALVGVLGVSGGLDGASPAYASWTPGPSPVEPDAQATAEAACRQEIAVAIERLTSGLGDDPDLAPTAAPEDYRTVAAERRGGYLFLAMAAADGSDQTCFFDAGDPSQVQGASGGGATAASAPPAPLAGDAIEGGGMGSSGGPEGAYGHTTGRVGADVAGVTVKAEGREVEATLTDGWFAAWWPSDYSGTGPMPEVRYDVTLRDDTVIGDVPDTLTTRPQVPDDGVVETGRGGGRSEDGGEVVTVEGLVGSDVTGVTVVDGQTRVEAQLHGGGFFAQIPGTSTATENTTVYTYDLTLRDGTVLENRVPVQG